LKRGSQVNAKHIIRGVRPHVKSWNRNRKSKLFQLTAKGVSRFYKREMNLAKAFSLRIQWGCRPPLNPRAKRVAWNNHLPGRLWGANRKTWWN
jgi:hypothetical protein